MTQIDRNTSPSGLYFIANLATATFSAALEIEYGANSGNSTCRVKSRSPRADVSATTFLSAPALSSGRKALIVWIMPTTFMLNLWIVCLQRIPRFAKGRDTYICGDVLHEQLPILWAEGRVYSVSIAALVRPRDVKAYYWSNVRRLVSSGPCSRAALLMSMSSFPPVIFETASAAA